MRCGVRAGCRGKQALCLPPLETSADCPACPCPRLAQSDWLNFNRFTLRAEKTLPIGPLRWAAAAAAAAAAAGYQSTRHSRCFRLCLQSSNAVRQFTARLTPDPVPPRPCRAWVRGKGGMIVGDLPPYEAFPIGGTNSVRGYSEGALVVENP